MNIKIICVGKIKEKYLADAINEYAKRLTKYCNISIFEIEDEKFDSNMSEKELENIKAKECDKIIKELDKTPKAYPIALDLKGNNYSSKDLADRINYIKTYSASTIVFIIGGSLGLTKDVIAKCNESISFSTLTFPHQLIRVFLLEQIFRCFKINNNETYHW